MTKDNKKSKKTQARKVTSSKKTAVSSTFKTMDYPRWTFLIFVLLTFTIYWPTVNYGYVLDDVIVLQENNYVKKGFNGIVEIMTTESFQGYFGEQKNLVQGARYRPLSLVTFAIEHGIFGLKPGISHFINILLYALCALLLFQTIRLFKLNPHGVKWWFGPAFLCAIFYIVHPLHVEAVANIKGRDEIMSFLGSFGALYLSLKYIDTSKIYWLISAISVYFFGLLAKENTITFLAVIPLSHYFFREQSIKKAIQCFSLLAAMTVAYLAWRYHVIGYFLNSGEVITDVMNNPFAEMKSSQKTATIFYTLGKYLGLHLFPLKLTHDYYPYHIPITEWSSIKAWGSLVLHLALSAIAIYGLKKKKIYSYCILFYLATLSIVSNLIVGVGTFMNERFTFTASVAFCLGLSYYLHYYSSRSKTKLVALALGFVLILGYSMRSGLRVPVWKDALSLNTAASKVSLNSARMNSFMATALYKTYNETTDRNEKIDLLQRADVYARKSILIRPSYKNANIMLSGIATEQYGMDRDLPKLLNTFKEIIKSRPDIEHVRTYLEYLNKQDQNRASLVKFYSDISNLILIPQRKIDWALHFLSYGIKLDPQDQNLVKACIQAYQLKGDNVNAAKFRSKLQ